MRIIKRISNKTYEGKNGKNYHYTNYYLELDNGKRVGIRTISSDDIKLLEAVAVLERVVEKNG